MPPAHQIFSRIRPGLFCGAFLLVSASTTDQFKRMARDHQFFIGWYDVNGDAAVLSRYKRLRLGVRTGVQRDTEPCELISNASAHCRGIFADAGRENERIKAAKRSGQHSSKQS